MRRLAIVLGGWLFVAVLAAPASAALRMMSLEEAEATLAAQGGGGANEMFVQLVPPTDLKGYRWTVLAYKASPRAKTSLTIVFVRTRGSGTQSQISEFRWALPRTALRIASDLRPVSLDTRRGMGDNGLVDMRLTLSEQYMRAPAEEGCSGAVSVRIGYLGGRFRFNARDEYFKRISMAGVHAFVYREHDYRCKNEQQPPKPCPYDLQLHAVAEDAGASVTAMKTTKGRVDQRFVAVRALDTGTATHAIFAGIAVPEAFEASDDLTSASVDGDAAGPWLSGDLDYVGAPAAGGEDEACGAIESSSGLATGDYTAHFDSIGDVTVAATAMPATLQRRI